MTLRIKQASALRRRELLKAAMLKAPLSLEQMAAVIITTYKGAQSYRDALVEDGAIFIKRWKRVQGPKLSRWVAQYGWKVTGIERDAKKPAPVSPSGRAKAMRRRINANPEKRDRKRALRRLTDNPPKPDPLVQALFMRKAA